MKNLLLVFAVWVMFGNSQIYKYPQADVFLFGSGHDYVPWQDKLFYLVNSNSGVTIITLPQYKVKEIGYSMSVTKAFHVYKNPNIDCYSDDYRVKIVGGVRKAMEDKE